MYIKFKNKYKKIFWILLGFILSCIYVHKVYAAPSFETYDFNDFSFNFNNINYDKSTLFALIEDQLSLKNKNLEDYQYISVTVPSSPSSSSGDVRSSIQIFLQNISPTNYYSSTGFNSWSWTNSYTSYSFPQQPFTIQISLVDGSISSFVYTANNSYQMFAPWVFSGNSSSNTAKVYSNYDFSILPNTNSTPNFYTKFYYDPNMLSTGPDYLQGYTEITLDPGERYVIFSSSTITSGSVYIPISDFNDYGSRISYFDKDIDTQPYTSYIQDFTTTSDGLYAKQDFDLSSYTGSDFIMFSKYIYLEGPDDFSSSVWVPSAMYSSIVEVTPNNTGGNDFDYSYVDENGELQANVISSSDLSQGSPLVSDLFTNFTTKDYGLSSIITAPIPLLQTLNNTSCSTVELPLGVFGGVHDQKLSLPCMTPIYSSIFGELFTLYQTITSGVIAYFIGLAYFNRIKQLKDPDNDSIEVVDL